jgi:hypothetical protein
MAAASIPVAGLDPASRDQLVERIRHALLKRMERRGRPNSAPGSLPSRRLAPPAEAGASDAAAPEPGAR